ncbi:N-formylglutamate amidohydrolase [Desulfonema magnum]|uniref:N-formylglutamate amidohydrolase family protein n=1 Tax=Desulfonema magnum TaxID=45655 RepID=A0A975BJL7_9BACT|nr:N-formylglutamate amidohydrolase [Desulfonema magnum]QTA86573.1 N-formylglutamate amidohydrolase family protein [Desulfonema magnum]
MRLPFLLSVPHAGLNVPPEVADIIILSQDDIIRDGDEGAAEIYLPMKEQVDALVTTEIARAVIDMNRAEDDRRKDGVVKTHTCWDVPIYREPLSDRLAEQLLERYHRPYHQRLDKYTGSVMVGIDCHTMAASGPPGSPDPGKIRPSVCLSNGHGTCPDSWLISLAHIIEKELGAKAEINTPFKGGYIIRHHSEKIPWFQIEVSREPFMSNTEKFESILESLKKWFEHGI